MTSRASTLPLTAPVAGPRRHKVSSELLCQGLFVNDLDRPWLDTPFLIQGFQIDSDVELATLKKYCRHVFVDLEMSDPQAVAYLRALDATLVDAYREAAAEQTDRRSLRRAPGDDNPATLPRGNVSDEDARQAIADASPVPDDDTQARPAASASARPKDADAKARQRTYRVRADVQISTDTRDRFRRFVRETTQATVDEAPGGQGSIARRLLDTVLGLFGRRRAGGGAVTNDEQQARLDQEIAVALPAGAQRQSYEIQRDVAEEMPRARQSFEKGEHILGVVLADVRQGKVPEVARVKDAVGHMVDSMVDNPDALMWVAQLREAHLQTYQHGVRVSLYMIALGRELGFPKEMLESLGLIGMLADVGKTKLPRALLDKPGMLNTAEFSIAKEHVRLGLEALNATMQLPVEAQQGIMEHHERLDGSGYPKGLKGDEISIYGRMAGIADSFAALITPRPYANPLAPQDALMSLYQWAGSSFHAPLVEHFVQAVGVFPVGGLCELSSGEVAVVLAHNRVRRLEPKVLVLTTPDKRPLAEPIQRDLLTQKTKDASGRNVRIMRGLSSGAYGLKLRDIYAHESTSALLRTA